MNSPRRLQASPIRYTYFELATNCILAFVTGFVIYCGIWAFFSLGAILQELMGVTL